MVDLDVQIKRIQEKLQLILKQQILLQKENLRLKKELEKANSSNVEKQDLLQLMQQQVDALKLGSGSLDQTEKIALGKRIDLYLKEIDKCIAILNN
jgi:hypothetical protein